MANRQASLIEATDVSPNDVPYCLQQLDRDVVGSGRGVARLDRSVLCFLQRDFLGERYLPDWADRDPWVRDVIRCRAAFKSAASQRIRFVNLGFIYIVTNLKRWRLEGSW